MNYFEFYPGDYLRDTTRLTLAEHGAYLRLLMAYYSDEQPLPAENDALFRIVSAQNTAEKQAVLKVADLFFPVTRDGVRHNARADAEIAKAQGRMDASPSGRKATQAERAKRYRERRSAMFALLREHGITMDFNVKAEELEAAVMKLAGKGNRHVDRHAERDENRDECDGVTRDMHRDVTASRPQTPDPNKQQDQDLLGETSQPPKRNRFEEFWAVYPVKKGKAAAEAKWKARKLDAIADRIIADVKLRATSDRQWLEGFIPHGSTYVNGKGWEDAIEGIRPAAAPGQPAAKPREYYRATNPDADDPDAVRGAPVNPQKTAEIIRDLGRKLRVS